jgi:hypothetical protein
MPRDESMRSTELSSRLAEDESPMGLDALQAAFRARRARQLHGERAKQGGVQVICPFVASPRGVAAVMVQATGLRSGETVLDLGCGDGELMIDVLRLLPRCRCVGYEIDGVLAATARRRLGAVAAAEGLGDSLAPAPLLLPPPPPPSVVVTMAAAEGGGGGGGGNCSAAARAASEAPLVASAGGGAAAAEDAAGGGVIAAAAADPGWAVVTGDVLRAGDDIAAADVVLMFLVPSAVAALSPIFRARCRTGARVCSYNFPLPAADGWVPSAVLEAPHHLLSDEGVAGGRKSTVYAYVVGDSD